VFVLVAAKIFEAQGDEAATKNKSILAAIER
jgi:hypothetical protein